jgi:NADH-quinone oxidoreductase subunit K
VTPLVGPATLLLSALLFLTGMVGVLVRRNAIVLFMSVELMMNAANLCLVSFAQQLGAAEGRALVFFALTVAAAEAGVGLAILIALYRRTGSIDVDALDRLRW